MSIIVTAVDVSWKIPVPRSCHITLTLLPINKDMENRHYCIDCTMEALEFLEPKKKPEKKLEENVQKKPLDPGKVMALHNAGWDNAKIADELGVRERQVYMCIYYQENKKSLTQEENHE